MLWQRARRRQPRPRTRRNRCLSSGTGRGSWSRRTAQTASSPHSASEATATAPDRRVVHTRRAAIGATASDTTASTISETRTTSGARVIRSGFVTHAGRQRRSRKGSRNRWRARIAATDANATARNTADRERNPSAATTVTGSKAASAKPSTTSRGVSEWSSPGANSASSTGPTIGGAVRLDGDRGDGRDDDCCRPRDHRAGRAVVDRREMLGDEERTARQGPDFHRPCGPSPECRRHARIIVVRDRTDASVLPRTSWSIHVRAVPGCLRRPAGVDFLTVALSTTRRCPCPQFPMVGGHDE